VAATTVYGQAVKLQVLQETVVMEEGLLVAQVPSALARHVIVEEVVVAVAKEEPRLRGD
jgi:hypothetical protein